MVLTKLKICQILILRKLKKWICKEDKQKIEEEMG